METTTWIVPLVARMSNAERGRRDPRRVSPAVVTALAAILTGVLAGLAFSPLGWATLIVERYYLP